MKKILIFIAICASLKTFAQDSNIKIAQEVQFNVKGLTPRDTKYVLVTRLWRGEDIVIERYDAFSSRVERDSVQCASFLQVNQKKMELQKDEKEFELVRNIKPCK